MRILVIGGTGFVGRGIVARLVQAGHEVHVPTRRVTHARELLVLPTVTIVQANVHEDADLNKLVKNCDAVINLPGILHSRSGQPYGPDFAQVHVQLPRRLASACKQHGVKRLIHMSALGASEQGPSGYLRSKADGEAAIREILANDPHCSYTILRPSVIFGPEDKFMNMFAKLARVLPLMPMAGASARMQPIYVSDVVSAFINVLNNPATAGQTYSLAGPRVYTLGELVELAAKWSGHPRTVIEMPLSLGHIQALFFECLPGEPLMSRDNLASLSVDNVMTEPLSPDLGIVPTPLESVAPNYLKR